MACKDALKKRARALDAANAAARSIKHSRRNSAIRERLVFGVDTETQAYDMLQNNLTVFEWVDRNKIYPAFWGRYLTGENCLTGEEVAFIHSMGCKIAALCRKEGEKLTEAQGEAFASDICLQAAMLGAHAGAAIFLEVPDGEEANTAFMKGYAKEVLFHGFVPGFKANTDAAVSFDREFSRGLQTDRNIFSRCLVWAMAPSLPEYERVTTTHLVHPDRWMPYAPSSITRRDVAVWQYGRNCHPIENEDGDEVCFHVNLVRDTQVINRYMF